MISKLSRKKGVVAAQGFSVSATAVGIKKGSKKDCMLLVSNRPCQAAGLFTTNQLAAAPVQLSRQALAQEKKHVALFMNSGIANACTGPAGLQAATQLNACLATQLGCKATQLLQASTGVIGQPLPLTMITNNLPKLIANLQTRDGLSAAQAIMTTDTCPKMAEISVMINRRQVTVGGIAKGSGMIHPNMATMLAALTTDVALTKTELNRYLRLAAKTTFNAISIDGENSTNDSVFLLANGEAGPASRPTTDKSKRDFIEALTAVMDDLAQQIVKDGEGATKLIDIRVQGAKNEHEAMLAARAVGDSQLVKTAIYGEDANWGRILQSLGATAVKLNPNKISVCINGKQLVQSGMDAGLTFAQGNRALKNKIITMVINLGVGKGQARYRTCDLTKQYIDINAGYRS